MVSGKLSYPQCTLTPMRSLYSPAYYRDSAPTRTYRERAALRVEPASAGRCTMRNSLVGVVVTGRGTTERALAHACGWAPVSPPYGDDERRVERLSRPEALALFSDSCPVASADHRSMARRRQLDIRHG